MLKIVEVIFLDYSIKGGGFFSYYLWLFFRTAVKHRLQYSEL